MTDAPRKVQHRHSGHEGLFFVEEGGRRIAELTYTLAGDVATADHTFVDPQFRGGALAPSLVEALVAWAREGRRRIVPRCSYVRSVLHGSPEYADVRAQSAS